RRAAAAATGPGAVPRAPRRANAPGAGGRARDFPRWRWQTTRAAAQAAAAQAALARTAAGRWRKRRRTRRPGGRRSWRRSAETDLGAQAPVGALDPERGRRQAIFFRQLPQPAEQRGRRHALELQREDAVG